MSHDVLGRLMLMSAREPGLASVYGEVLGFDGDEFYLEAWDELVGLPFAELALRFPNAIPIGLRSAETGAITLKVRDRHDASHEESLSVCIRFSLAKQMLPPPHATRLFETTDHRHCCRRASRRSTAASGRTRR